MATDNEAGLIRILFIFIINLYIGDVPMRTVHCSN